MQTHKQLKRNAVSLYIIYSKLSPPEWFYIKMDSGVSHFNISLTVQGKVTRQSPYATFVEKGEPKWNWTKVLLLTSQRPHHWAKLAHTHPSVDMAFCFMFSKFPFASVRVVLSCPSHLLFSDCPVQGVTEQSIRGTIRLLEEFLVSSKHFLCAHALLSACTQLWPLCMEVKMNIHTQKFSEHCAVLKGQVQG